MPETPKTPTTILCDQGHHGTAVRRSALRDGWQNMYQGACAGTVFFISERTEADCTCSCHDA